METKKNEEVLITEDMLSRYHRLNTESKKLEEELKQLKRIFHSYFDKHVGENSKGEYAAGNFILQRRIQTKNEYIQDKTIQKLEDLNLVDCIQTIRHPDPEKIDAAITLGILSQSDLDECISRKITPSIWVKEID